MQKRVLGIILVGVLLSLSLVSAFSLSFEFQDWFAKIFPGITGEVIKDNGCDSSLVAYYKFDEASGNAVLDSSGNGMTGTLMNGAGRVDEKFGKALNLDGVPRANKQAPFAYLGNLKAKVPAITGKGAFSISLWVNNDKKTNEYVTIIQQRDANLYNGGYMLRWYGMNSNVDKRGQISWFTYGDKKYGFVGLTNKSFDKEWHHIVAIRDGSGTGKVYVDGILEGEWGSQARTLIPINIALGGNPRDNAGWFKGQIDEVSIWNKELSEQEINTLYNSGNGNDACYQAPQEELQGNVEFVSPSDSAVVDTITPEIVANVALNREVGYCTLQVYKMPENSAQFAEMEKVVSENSVTCKFDAGDYANNIGLQRGNNYNYRIVVHSVGDSEGMILSNMKNFSISPGVVPGECNETDTGIDYYNKGKIDYFYNVPSDQFYGMHVSEDTCNNDGTLTEFACAYYSPTQLGPSAIYNCSSEGKICAGGKCINPPTLNCIDTDGGIDYAVKGNTTGYEMSLVEYDTLIDYCGYQDYDMGKVHEYYCGQGNEEIMRYSTLSNQINENVSYCPYGCENGACIQQQLVNADFFAVESGTGKDIANITNFAVVDVWGIQHYGSLNRILPGGGVAYHLDNLTVGNYTVNVSAFGYVSQATELLFINSNFNTLTFNLDKVIVNCNDSDGGVNYYIAGNVSGNIGSGYPNGWNEYGEYCINNTILIERYCTNDYTNFTKNYDCSSEEKICENGACLSSATELDRCSELSNDIKARVAIVTSQGYRVVKKEGDKAEKDNFIIMYSRNAPDKARLMKVTSIQSNSSTINKVTLTDIITYETFDFATGLGQTASTNIDGYTYHVQANNAVGLENRTIRLTWGTGSSPGNTGLEQDTFSCNFDYVNENDRCSEISNNVKSRIIELENSGNTVVKTEGGIAKRDINTGNGYVVIYSQNAPGKARILKLNTLNANTSSTSKVIFTDAITYETFDFATGFSNTASGNIDGQTYYVYVNNSENVNELDRSIRLTWGTGSSPGNTGLEMDTFNCSNLEINARLDIATTKNQYQVGENVELTPYHNIIPVQSGSGGGGSSGFSILGNAIKEFFNGFGLTGNAIKENSVSKEDVNGNADTEKIVSPYGYGMVEVPKDSSNGYIVVFTKTSVGQTKINTDASAKRSAKGLAAQKQTMTSQELSIEQQQNAILAAEGIAEDKIMKRFDYSINAVVVDISKTQADALAKKYNGYLFGLFNKQIKMVYPNLKVNVLLDSSIPVMGIDTAKQAYGNLTGEGVTIAIIDTGIDATHESLDDMDDNPETNDAKVIAFQDMVNFKEEAYDDHGHGTHVSGTAAGTGGPSKRYVGVAPGAKLVGVKVLDSWGSGSFDQVIAGMEWVLQNKDVYNISIISMSLGASLNSDGTTPVEIAADTIVDSGINMIVAAGNSGYLGPKSVGIPASAKKVIAVGAVDDNLDIASFSSRGPSKDGRIKPEISAIGVDVTAPVPKGNCNLCDASGYLSLSGTSMATPHVSGIAALLLQANPNLKPTDMRNLLQKTAIDKGQEGLDNDYGAGIANTIGALLEIIPKQHEISITDVKSKGYVNYSQSTPVEFTVNNLGLSNENVVVKLIVNDIEKDSKVISVESKKSVKDSFNVYGEQMGLMNVVVKAEPVEGEEILGNNEGKTEINVVNIKGRVKAVVLDSWGSDYSQYTSFPQLNSKWTWYGDYALEIDYTSLNKEGITYNDLLESNADVLIISDAWQNGGYVLGSNWDFTDDEISAINQYVREGHGLIATSGTLSTEYLDNNMKLASLFGIDPESEGKWSNMYRSPMKILVKDDILTNNFGSNYYGRPDTAYDLEIKDNKAIMVAYAPPFGDSYDEGFIVSYKPDKGASVYFSNILEYSAGATWRTDDDQFLYNAIVWTAKSIGYNEHDIAATNLEVPKLKLNEKTTINFTLTNNGINSELVNVDILLNNNSVGEEVVSLESQTSKVIYANVTFNNAGLNILNVKVNAVEGETFMVNNEIMQEVTVPGAYLTGNFTETPIDIDGDGLYDYLNINLDARVVAEGWYHVRFGLYSKLGVLIAYGEGYIDAYDFGNQGIEKTYNVKTQIEGWEIRKYGLNGPYTIKNVQLQSQGLILSTIENMGETQAWKANQFTTPKADVQIGGLNVNDYYIVNEPAEFKVDIRNSGAVDAENVTLGLYNSQWVWVNDTYQYEQMTLITSKSLGRIGAGQGITNMPFAFTPNSTGYNNQWLIVNATNEIKTDNNVGFLYLRIVPRSMINNTGDEFRGYLVMKVLKRNQTNDNYQMEDYRIISERLPMIIRAREAVSLSEIWDGFGGFNASENGEYQIKATLVDEDGNPISDKDGRWLNSESYFSAWSQTTIPVPSK